MVCMLARPARRWRREALPGAIAACVAAAGGCADDGPVGEPAGPAAVASIVVTPVDGTTVTGATIPFSAALVDAAGNVLTDRPVAWSTDDTATASIDSTGAVTGVAPGATIVRARSEGRLGTAAVLVTPVPRVGHYAALSGTPAGDGSIERPWDLASALAGGNGQVRPGDTVWVRGGTYYGPFSSTLQGSPGAPIVVRGFPGERAVIDGAGTRASTFLVGGDWTVFWGLEFTNSDPARNLASTANDARPNTIVNDASNVTYVHLIVHDGGTAFFTFPERGGVEITGSIFYNNGWQAPTRADGHALYLKSYGGGVLARDNVLFNQFGYGVHAYTDRGSGQLINIRLEGNVAFNNGLLASTRTARNLLLGGADYATDDVLARNLTYYSPGVQQVNVEVGFRSVANGTVAVAGNYIVRGNPVLRVGSWDRVTFDGNVLVGDERLMDLQDTTVAGYQWDGTRHYRDPLSASWGFRGVLYSWLLWRTATGLGLSDLATEARPSQQAVFVRPSSYEPGRATVVVYNWSGEGAVAVDLGNVLAAGERYAVHNVQDLFGPPVTSGTYDGVLVLPLTGVSPPVPVGMAVSPAPRTGPEFDVFIVTRR